MFFHDLCDIFYLISSRQKCFEIFYVDELVNLFPDGFLVSITVREIFLLQELYFQSPMFSPGVFIYFCIFHDESCAAFGIYP